MKKLIWTGAKIYLGVNAVLGLHALWLFEAYSDKTIIELAADIVKDSDGFLERTRKAVECGTQIRKNGDFALLHPRKFGKLFRHYAKEEG